MEIKFKIKNQEIDFVKERGDILNRQDIIDSAGIIVIDSNGNDLSELIVLEGIFNDSIKIQSSFKHNISWYINIDNVSRDLFKPITISVFVKEEDQKLETISLDIVENLDELAIFEKKEILGNTPGDYLIPEVIMDFSSYDINNIKFSVNPILSNGDIINSTNLLDTSDGFDISNKIFHWKYSDTQRFPFTNEIDGVIGIYYKLTIEKQILEIRNDKSSEFKTEQKKIRMYSYDFTNIYPPTINDVEEDKSTEDIPPVNKRLFNKNLNKKTKKTNKQTKKDAKIVKELGNKTKVLIISVLVVLFVGISSTVGGYIFYNNSMQSISSEVKTVQNNQNDAKKIMNKSKLTSDDFSELSKLLNSNKAEFEKMKSNNIFVANKRKDLVNTNNKLIDKASKLIEKSSGSTEE